MRSELFVLPSVLLRPQLPHPPQMLQSADQANARPSARQHGSSRKSETRIVSMLLLQPRDALRQCGPGARRVGLELVVWVAEFHVSSVMTFKCIFDQKDVCNNFDIDMRSIFLEQEGRVRHNIIPFAHNNAIVPSPVARVQLFGQNSVGFRTPQTRSMQHALGHNVQQICFVCHQYWAVSRHRHVRPLPRNCQQNVARGTRFWNSTSQVQAKARPNH